MLRIAGFAKLDAVQYDGEHVLGLPQDLVRREQFGRRHRLDRQLRTRLALFKFRRRWKVNPHFMRHGFSPTGSAVETMADLRARWSGGGTGAATSAIAYLAHGSVSCARAGDAATPSRMSAVASTTGLGPVFLITHEFYPRRGDRDVYRGDCPLGHPRLRCRGVAQSARARSRT